MRAKAVLAYMIFFLGASIWPGASLVNQVEPKILGLPFNFAWYAFLIVGAFIILLWLDAEQQRKEQD